MLRLEVDTSGIERDVLRFEREMKSELASAAADLSEMGEAYIKDLLEAQIYSQPESPTYERTRSTIDNAKGYASIKDDGFEITLESIGGAEGRIYGKYLERGTHGSKVSLDQIYAEARAGSELEVPNYGQGKSGMRPRPTVIPAAAQVERDLEPRILEAVERAWG